jgi:hypothetical protein
VSVYVFTGPTLGAEEARGELDAVYLPPVSQGDVYRAARKRPRAIGIIDGYFECVPAVWHKEILWAMTQGVHVFGSASMGALRAAELAAFGMEGVGAVFAAYRDGTLEDDDEVAVAHGPAETGYRPHSVALVNIRATLFAAEKAGVVRPAVRHALEGIGKALFYPDRTYPRILSAAAARGIPDTDLRALREWLPAGAVNQKRDDALAMLRVMRDHLATDPQPKTVRYFFEHTAMWDHARRHAGELHQGTDGTPDALALPRLLDELRLEGDAYPRAHQAAWLRLLGLERASQQGIAVTPPLLEQAVEAFRRERGLLDGGRLAQWRDAQQVDDGAYARLMEEQARLRLAQAGGEREVTDRLVDHLRLTGEYGRLLARARDKQRVLDACGLHDPTLGDAAVTEAGLLRWYFETRLGRPVPPDLAVYAQGLGFEDAAAFRRAVLREFLYRARIIANGVRDDAG